MTPSADKNVLILITFLFQILIQLESEIVTDRAHVSSECSDTENVTEIQEDIEEVVETLEDDEDPHHVALAGHPGPRTDHRSQPR